MAAGVALLVKASLSGGDGVDATTVSFLLRENLRRTKEEEKERRRVRVEASEAMDRARLLLEQAGKRRERKKRRKRSFLDLAALVVDVGSGMFAMLVVLVVMHLEMCSLWSTTGP